MNLPSSVTKSLYHQIVVTVIPGSLVVIPFFMAIYLSPNNRGFEKLIASLESSNADHFAIYVVVAMLVFLIGLVLENIGSWIEDCILDKCNGVSVSAWRFYLFSKCGDNELKVIHKYFDSIVFRYKFELSMVPALLVFFIEWVWICLEEHESMSCWFISLVSVLILVLIYFTCLQAKISCEYLNNLRIAYMSNMMLNEENKNDKALWCKKCQEVIEGKCCSCGENK